MVMIFTWPSTTGFQRGDFTLAGVKTVLLCSAHALEIFIQDRADPVLVPGNCYFAIIRGDRWSHAAKIGQSIIIDPDPVPDIAFGHSFSVKVITVGEGSDKDRDLCGLIRVPAVMQIELLPA